MIAIDLSKQEALDADPKAIQEINSLFYKQKIIQFIRRNQVYFSFSNVSTDTTVIVKDYMLSEKFTFYFKITIKWNLTKSHATRIK